MSERDRSEPAFPGKLPLPDTSGAEAQDFAFFGGMTVRDYFAGQAIGAFVARFPMHQAGQGLIDWRCAAAHEAYALADAMLAERGQGGAA